MKSKCSEDGNAGSWACLFRSTLTSDLSGFRLGKWPARTVLVLSLLLSLSAFAGSEVTFPLLKVGNATYQNVTVTTKGKNFIIIVHSGGIASIKTDLLPVNVLKRLGYLPPSAPKKRSTGPKLIAAL